MGLLAELYVAGNDEEAVKYDTSPDEFTDRRQYRNFTSLELSTLWAIMQGTQWNVDLMDQFPDVLVVDAGERSVQRLPTPMIKALAEMTREDVLRSSTKWASTDEMRCQPSDLQPIIEGLIHLSRSASATARGVYLWNCV